MAEQEDPCMMRVLGFWEQFVQDLRYAVRTMVANPLFTAMATLSLALGIGANTAIYSFMDAVLLRALPVRNPETLVVLDWRSQDHPPVVHSLSGTSGIRRPATPAAIFPSLPTSFSARTTRCSRPYLRSMGPAV
jgi:hypothetical protein